MWNLATLGNLAFGPKYHRPNDHGRQYPILSMTTGFFGLSPNRAAYRVQDVLVIQSEGRRSFIVHHSGSLALDRSKGSSDRL